jgi:hypothetical protein
MATYEMSVDTLAGELETLEDCLRGLGPDAWDRPTMLEPFDPAARPWTVKELVAHIDISIGLTLSFLESTQAGQPGRDRVSFFIADRSQVAPVVYDYARSLADQHTPATLIDKVRDTFRATVAGTRAHAPDTIGSGYFALMRLDEWVPTRTLEAVVHGIDLTNALARPVIARPAGVATTAAILDELLARRTVAGRAADLADDVDYIRAAAGRLHHPDPRFPLLV